MLKYNDSRSQESHSVVYTLYITESYNLPSVSYTYGVS